MSLFAAKSFIQLTMQRIFIIALLAVTSAISVLAQGPSDHVYMVKQEACVELFYARATWNQYWEGTKLRNTNFGNVTHHEARASMAYGITDRVNVLFSLPWMRNSLQYSPTAPQQDLQDISLGAKWMIIGTPRQDAGFKLAAVGMFSTPLGGYYFDMLPCLSVLGQHKACYEAWLLGNQIKGFMCLDLAVLMLEPTLH